MTECNAISRCKTERWQLKTSTTHGFNDKNNTSYIPTSAGSFVAEKADSTPAIVVPKALAIGPRIKATLQKHTKKEPIILN
jgi:hypothetical protein